MFEGFSEKTVDFMWNIRFNNEKSWFEAHKDEYKKHLAQPMKELALDVDEAISERFPELGLLPRVSRIYRDARRLHGNGPYKDHLWFTLSHGDELMELPVFWFELDPQKWSYGLGYYRARASTMEKHRARIEKDPKPLAKLMRALNSQSEFILEGESYARPKGDPGELLRDWYNKKTFSLIHEEGISDAVYSPDLKNRLVEGFSFLVPYYKYFSSLDRD